MSILQSIMASSTHSSITQSRETKYCRSIRVYIATLGHVTNAELLQQLRKDYPALSATTVHRATARLSDRGEIGVAPSSIDGSVRYDANTEPHDHFMCSECGALKDVDIAESVKELIKEKVADCDIGGRVVVNGLCKKCSIKRGSK